MHVGDDPVHVPRRVGAQVVHGHLVPAGEGQDVVLHRVGRQHGQLGLLVRLDVLRLFSQAGAPQDEMLDPRDPIPQAGQTKPILHSLWGALLQAFTVEDVFQRKIK